MQFLILKTTFYQDTFIYGQKKVNLGSQLLIGKVTKKVTLWILGALSDGCNKTTMTTNWKKKHCEGPETAQSIGKTKGLAICFIRRKV